MMLLIAQHPSNLTERYQAKNLNVWLFNLIQRPLKFLDGGQHQQQLL